MTTPRPPRPCPTCGRTGNCADCCCSHPAHRYPAPQRPARCPLCNHATTDLPAPDGNTG